MSRHWVRIHSVAFYSSVAGAHVIASTACLPHYTSGQSYFYPAFNASRTEDAVKFAHEFGEVLAMPIMLEAVIRVRGSRGACPSPFPSTTCFAHF